MAASQKLQHFIQQQVELHTTVEQNEGVWSLK